MHFTFSDTISGYITSPAVDGVFTLKTADAREFRVKLTSNTWAENLRNLGEPFQDPGAPLDTLLVLDRYITVYGIFYPEGNDYSYEAKHIFLMGRGGSEFRFEAQDWWIRQIRALADFYFNAQFPDGEIDYTKYRTHLSLEGQQIHSTRQETDTISRMIYGFATAYLLTGVDKYLEAAEKGTEYLREHMRALDEEQDIVYWYHAIDLKDGRERKIFASQFGDDYDAIPAYEQIYALAGPTQTYRVTGDPRILSDIQRTLNLFERFFRDREKGGFFSHVDPVNFDPRAESLGQDRARKNWNSVGDHAPAYLINLWLATGEKTYLDFLVDTANTVVEYFPDYDHSPFVQERFHEDWSHDKSWGWQQNRAVVGHNLKIAWNLMRIHHAQPNNRYTDLAKKIAAVMPDVGMDRQRGGWYDVMERELQPGQDFHRLVWHDRKAWWQQEQAILAYFILAGSLQQPEYHRLARESAAFYNAYFPDQDSGGVYFNVLASGVPFLLGTERLKGSHSMSGYHSFELCYLAAVYTNLLITKQPMDFYFKPKADGFKDRVLRVRPDILPEGSLRLEGVWINGEPYADFDPIAMTINLPDPQKYIRASTQLLNRPAWSGAPRVVTASIKSELDVRVRVVPSDLKFDVLLDISDGTAVVTLEGIFEDVAVPALKLHLDKVVGSKPKTLMLRMENVQSLSKRVARALVFAQQDLSLETDVYVVTTNDSVRQTLDAVGFLELAKLVSDSSYIGASRVRAAGD